MNLPTLNPLLPSIPKPTLPVFHNPLFNPSMPVNHYHPFPIPLMHPKSPPTYTPSLSDRSTNNSSNIPQISPELDHYITLQQQIVHPHTLTIHHLSSVTTSSGPPTPTPLSDYTPSLAQSSTSTETSTSTNRAYRTFKHKFPIHPFTTKPGTAKEYVNHPQHQNTKAFLQTNLPLLPQYTLNTPTTNDDIRNFLYEHVLMPTLHWTSYYHYTNPLFLPLYNTLPENEKCKKFVIQTNNSPITTSINIRWI